jgi:type IV secretion system T-DNA border endonuclease VirD2
MTGLPSVPVMIWRGAQAPAHTDPVDAVMGEEWAALELGRGGAVRRLAYGEHRRLGAKRKRLAIGGAIARNPQSLVKMIGSGGTSNARGLRAQMAYLSREGDVPLHSSESAFGMELSAHDAAEIASAWGVPDTSRGGADRTSHFVVSFPEGTDPAAAERAGRAWAMEMFDSGAHGDRWDYYTAFHTDTANPHMHVVVGRRGLDEGEWLRISARGAITFDHLRELQVEVAEREGIHLTHTRRLERGVHDRPIPDAEIRRARAEGREPVAPEHTLATAVAAAAAVLEYSRVYDGAAEAIRIEHPEIAGLLDAAAMTLVEGRQLVEEREIGFGQSTRREVIALATSIEEKQAEVQRNFAELDNRVREIEDPARRMEILRDIAGLKAETAPLIREDRQLQSYGPETPHADYRGLVVEAGDRQAELIKEAADRAVARLAERFGIQPEAAVARYGDEGVSLGLGRDYRAQELAERAADREARGERAETLAEANAGVADFHQQAGAVYRDAAERLREIERLRETERERGSPEASRVDPAVSRGAEPTPEREEASREERTPPRETDRGSPEAAERGGAEGASDAERAAEFARRIEEMSRKTLEDRARGEFGRDRDDDNERSR